MSRGLSAYYGADSTGQVDAAGLIRLAMVEAGGKTEAEFGVYRVDNPVHIHSRYGQRSPWLDGQGHNTSILLLKNAGAPAFIIGDDSGQNTVRWVRISNLQLVYENPPWADVPMFQLTRNVKGLILENIWARNYRTLIKVGENAAGLAGSCEDIHLVGIKADSAGSNTVSPRVMQIENVNGLWIDRCSISGQLNQILMHFTCEGSTTIDTVVVSNTLFKDGLTGVRAGDGTVSNVIFNGTIFDKIQSVAAHLETKPDRDLTNWQFDGCWYHSQNYGIIADQRAGGRIIRGSATGGSMDHAPNPFAILGGADFRRYGI